MVTDLGYQCQWPVLFLALVTTMVTKVDHGNQCSNDRGNHRSYYDGYYNGNAWFRHLLPRILPYLMTIGCEMNQILLRSLKNHLKRYILGEKINYHLSKHHLPRWLLQWLPRSLLRWLPWSTLVTIVVTKTRKRTTK